MPGLDDYASPILRAAVFRQLNPGAQISYTVVPIGTAFPLGHSDYEGKATEAVRCEIVLPDGSYIVAHKEIDKVDRGKEVKQTPEQMAKDETKALGRALRDGGIPQRLSELKELMRWIASMNGPSLSGMSPPSGVRFVDAPAMIEEAFPGTIEEPNDDSPDAGAEEPTTEQVLARQFAFLDGADKAAVVKYARETLGVSNVMRAGEHAEALIAYINSHDWLAVAAQDDDDIAAHDRKNEERRTASAASLEPEEPF